MRVERRHLEVIVAVAEARSISRAAAALHVAQPALTAQLKRIERALGGVLFERGAAGVLPTELGLEVIGRSRTLLAEFDRLCQTSQTLAAGRAQRPVRVAGVVGAFLPMLVDALAARFVDRRVTRYDGLPVSAMLAALAGGQTDVAVLHEFPGRPVRLPPGVRGQTVLAMEPVFVAVPGPHRLAGRGEIELADLAGDDWVLPLPDEDGLNDAFEAACRQAGFEPRVRCRTADRIRTREAVEEGCVSGTYPSAAIWNGQAILTLRGSPLRRRVLLAWPEESEIAALGPELAKELVEGYEHLVLSRPDAAPWWHAHRRAAVHGRAGDLVP